MLQETTFYLQIALESSRRTRSVFLLLQVVAVLVFLVLWNVRVDWLRHRILLARATVAYLEHRERALLTGEPMAESYLGVPADRIKEYVEARAFTKPRDAQYVVDAFERFRVNHFHNVSLPLFGVVIDLNHVGLLGGVSLLAVLIWLRFSLWRNMEDVKLAFERSRGTGDSRLIYDVLSASQLLSLPRVPSESRMAGEIWHWVPRLMLLVPSAMQVFLLYADVSTFRAGYMVSPTRAFMSVGVSAVLFVFIVYFCRECWTLLRQIDQQWEISYKIFAQ